MCITCQVKTNLPEILSRKLLDQHLECILCHYGDIPTVLILDSIVHQIDGNLHFVVVCLDQWHYPEIISFQTMFEALNTKLLCFFDKV